MVNKFLVFFVCCVLLSPSIKADVYYADGVYNSSRVNIIIDEGYAGEVLVKFEYCKAAVQGCETLGSRDFYSLEELQDRRASELWEAAYASGTSLALFGLAGAAMAGSLVSISLVTGFVVYLTYTINPIEQYEQAETLSDSVLGDEDVGLERGDFGRFVDRLTLVLDKIDAAK